METSKETIENPLQLPDDVFQAFQIWYDEAVKTLKVDPSAMTLATATPDGRPSARIVLFKGVSRSPSGREGVEFYGNYESRKFKQLAENPNAALVFYWADLNRQLRFEGRVEKLTPEESNAYFQTRPRGSRIGAWSSPQSQPIKSREDLLTLVRHNEERFKDKEVPCPSNWGGWRLIPERVEFWQAGEFRLHDRALYEWDGRGWKVSRLAP